MSPKIVQNSQKDIYKYYIYAVLNKFFLLLMIVNIFNFEEQDDFFSRAPFVSHTQWEDQVCFCSKFSQSRKRKICSVDGVYMESGVTDPKFFYRTRIRLLTLLEIRSLQQKIKWIWIQLQNLIEVPDPALDIDRDPNPGLELDSDRDPALDLERDPVLDLDRDPDRAS